MSEPVDFNDKIKLGNSFSCKKLALSLYNKFSIMSYEDLMRKYDDNMDIITYIWITRANKNISHQQLLQLAKTVSDTSESLKDIL